MTLMMDVDGVLIRGRQADGGHWSVDLERDIGISPAALKEAFFEPFWNSIIVGKADLTRCLNIALQNMASRVSAEELIAYWFGHDSDVDSTLLKKISEIRSTGARVFLATNQESLRMHYILDTLDLRRHFDGSFCSGSLKFAKPSLGFFDSVVNKLGATPHELFLIDDKQENVAAAMAAAWRGLWWRGDAGALDLIDTLVP
jgi:putative hydrolase of the HAD superfamily